MTDVVVLQRLLLITLIAGAIGFERERHGRAAGFRTHILVGVGACLIMLTGVHLMEAMAGIVQIDPTRMAAQVVSGIGFLGAGTILRFGASIRGLTTAASLWAVGGVGLAVGSGFLSGALLTSAILLVVLLGLSRLERAMRKEQYHVLAVEMDGAVQDVARIRRLLGAHELEIRDFDVKAGDQPNRFRLEVHVKLLSDQSREDILQDLLRLEPAMKARWV